MKRPANTRLVPEARLALRALGLVALIVLATWQVGKASPNQAPSSQTTSPAHLAEHDYVLSCMGCHQRDGRGVEGNVPSLVGLDRHLLNPNGRAYLVRVPGVAQAGLSDERLAALMNWTLNRFGTRLRQAESPRPFRPYTADEIASLRERPLRSLPTPTP